MEYDPEEEDSTDDQNQDEPSLNSVIQSSFNSTGPKKPTKVFILYQLWAELTEVAKPMVVDNKKKINVVSHKPYYHGGKPKTNPTLG